MIWNDYARKLVEVLGIKGSPVSITYSMTPARDAETCKVSVCKAIVEVRDGKTINLTKETSACPGGTTYLGLGPKPEGEKATALKKFLVNGEKLFCSVACFHRATVNGPEPPLGLADNVVMSPLEKAELEPDLILFIVNPEQACRLIQLATYWDGISPKPQLTGAACRQAITYPLVSGEINITFLDWTARRTRPYKPDELILTVPYHRLHNLVSAIDRCTAGTARMEIPPEFRQALEE